MAQEQQNKPPGAKKNARRPQQETIPPEDKQQTGSKPSAPPPQSESDRIKQRKLQIVALIQKRCMEPIWMERLRKIARGDDSKIMRAVNSFTTHIANDEGSGKPNKKYICEASFPSLFRCFLEAFQLGLDIGGGRDLVYVVVYNHEADLEISYKGFVNALNRHFDNAYVQPGLVFKGDKFKSKITDNNASFEHEPSEENLFSQTWDKLIGSYCFFSYTLRENKEKVSRLVVIDKAGIEMIRSKAKQGYVWSDFWGEQTIKSTIRRAAKLPFAQIDFDEDELDPREIDNRHYQLEDGTSGGKDRLKALMESQSKILDEENEPVKDETGKKSDGAGEVNAPLTPTTSDVTADTPRGAADADGNGTAPVSSGVTTTEAGPQPEQQAPASPPAEEGNYTQISDADFEEEERP